MHSFAANHLNSLYCECTLGSVGESPVQLDVMNQSKFSIGERRYFEQLEEERFAYQSQHGVRIVWQENKCVKRQIASLCWK